MKPVRTLVAIVNEDTLKILENSGVGKGLAALPDGVTGRDEAAPYSDGPGRAFDSVGGTRHAMEPRTAPDAQARERWTREVVQVLARRFAAGGFDRLVIAAPAKMLGLLRAALDGPLAQALHADLAKDLVGVPDRDLPARFSAVAAF